MSEKNECKHCHMNIEIRNPSGFCDHLYYPYMCEVCKAANPSELDKLRAESAQLREELSWYKTVREPDLEKMFNDATKENSSLREALEKSNRDIADFHSSNPGRFRAFIERRDAELKSLTSQSSLLEEELAGERMCRMDAEKKSSLLYEALEKITQECNFKHIKEKLIRHGSDQWHDTNKECFVCTALSHFNNQEQKKGGGMRQIKFRAWNKEGQFMLNNLNGGCGYKEQCLMDVIGNENYEVMQFTGLRDKTGKEIWEGDVVRALYYYDDEDDKKRPENVKIFEVKFKIDEGRQFSGFDFFPSRFEYIEVLGNIYENPELLRAEKKEGK